MPVYTYEPCFYAPMVEMEFGDGDIGMRAGLVKNYPSPDANKPYERRLVLEIHQMSQKFEVGGIIGPEHNKEFEKDPIAVMTFPAQDLGAIDSVISNLQKLRQIAVDKLHPMIYTIGETKLYEKYFQEQTNPEKGIGGSVFLTKEDAKKLITNDPNYSVYGVVADWEKDTKQEEDLSWRSLTKAARLVKL